MGVGIDVISDKPLTKTLDECMSPATGHMLQMPRGHPEALTGAWVTFA
jgi:hypothetical protein